MSNLTKSSLLSSFPDNTSQAIHASNLRDFVDSTIALLAASSTDNLIVAQATDVVPLIIQSTSPSGQTADLTQWNNGGGTTLAKVDASGNITAPAFFGDGSGLTNLPAGWSIPYTYATGGGTPSSGQLTDDSGGEFESIENLYFSTTDANGHDATNWLSTIKIGDGIKLFDYTSSQYVFVTVLSTPVSHTGYYSINVQYLMASSATDEFADNASINVGWSQRSPISGFRYVYTSSATDVTADSADLINVAITDGVGFVTLNINDATNPTDSALAIMLDNGGSGEIFLSDATGLNNATYMIEGMGNVSGKVTCTVVATAAEGSFTDGQTLYLKATPSQSGYIGGSIGGSCDGFGTQYNFGDPDTDFVSGKYGYIGYNWTNGLGGPGYLYVSAYVASAQRSTFPIAGFDNYGGSVYFTNITLVDVTPMTMFIKPGNVTYLGGDDYYAYKIEIDYVESLGEASWNFGSTSAEGAVCIFAIPNYPTGNLYLEDDEQHTITVTAPSPTASYPIVLPAAQGSNGNTLINDGSGNLSWGSPSAGSGASDTIEGTAGDTITAGNVIYQDIYNLQGYGAGYWFVADKTGTSPVTVSPFIGIAVTDAAFGDSFTIQTSGTVTGYSGLTVGEPVWVGIAGALTQTQPSAVVSGDGSQVAICQIGVAASSSAITLNLPPKITFAKYTASLANDSTVTVEHWTDAESRTRQVGSYIIGQSAQPTSLVGWWKLDEGTGSTTADSSFSGNTLTLTNSPTWSSSTPTLGYSNPHCLSFNSSDSQYCVASYSGGLPTGSGPVTMCGWIKTSTNNGSIMIPFAFGQATTSEVFAPYVQSGEILFTTYGEPNISSGPSIDDGNWHHIAVSYDGTTFKLYVDGGTPTTSTTGTLSLPSSGTIGIGGFYPPSGLSPDWFDGSVDDVRLYNVVLTATEIGYLAAGNNEDNSTSYPTYDAAVTMGNWAIDSAATGKMITRFTDGSGSNPNTHTTFQSRLGSAYPIINTVTL